MKIYSAQLKGTTTVATGSNVSLTGSFTGSIYGFDDTIQYSSSVDSRIVVNTNRLNNIESTTASFSPRVSNLESKSASVDISISNINSFTASNSNISLNQLSGSLATTGSNTFFGTQTFSGSVYIANNLVVQGSSSIEYISASSVSIGTNIVQLNTANPSVRFAGLTMIDSGSIGGSGSFLYDSVHDEFIFVHRGNGTNVTSSHFVLGPETYDSLGSETYLTTNILPKGTGKEHLIDSCIFDNGTTTCIKNNLVGTGTISGTTIYGSTAVCSPVGLFSGCVVIGSSACSPRALLDIRPANNTGQVLLIGEGGNTRTGFGLDSGTAGMRIFTTYQNQQMVDIGGIGSDGSTWTRNHRFGIAGCNSFLNECGGNVGIGTTTPTYKLDVYTTGGTSALRINSDATQNSQIRLDEASTVKFAITYVPSDATARMYFAGHGSDLITLKGSNVGIGTVVPNARLDLGTSYGSNGEKLLIYNDDSSTALAGTKVGFYMDRFSESNSVAFVFPQAGGTTSRYHIAYKNTSNTTLVDLAYLNYNSTSWVFPSDERMKNIEGIIPNALDKIKDLRAVYYTQKRDPEQKRKVGLLAQDLLKVLPEIVDVPDTEFDGEGNQRYMSVALADTIPLLVKAIQEQQCTICSQATMINTLKSCIGIV
jgi:hypothetical protein